MVGAVAGAPAGRPRGRPGRLAEDRLTEGIVVPPAWHELAGRIEAVGPAAPVYLLGADDTGKSTLGRWLLERLGAKATVALVDGDPGQGSLGPPATIGMAVEGRGGPCSRFIGSASPPGHLLPMLAGLTLLLERSRALGAALAIVDTPGWVEGPGAFEMHEHAIELVRPGVVVALERTPGEVEPILGPFRRRLAIQRLPASPEVRRRTLSVRQDRREERFRSYFREAGPKEVPLGSIPVHGPAAQGPAAAEAGRLVGVLDRDGFLFRLGILQRLEVEPARAVLLAPPFDLAQAASVRLGSIRVDPVTGAAQPIR